MTIELVQPFFNYGTAEGKRLVKLFRGEIFKAVANSDQSGLIFTMIWSFNEKGDWDYIKEISDIFSNKGGEICFVELEADTEVRVERNKTGHRLTHKPTKRDIEWSEGELLNSLNKHRLNSNEGEIENQNYIRINNTDLSPEEVAKRVKERFSL